MLIRSIAVVVPAHDEEDRLPACLAALRRAAHRPGVATVRIVVTADACNDRTVAVARRSHVEVVEIACRSAGAARRAGFEHVLRTTAVPLDELWLATTDADSMVPLDWFAMHTRMARAGWGAVVGTIVVSDWQDYDSEVVSRFKARYGPLRDDHPHVHGANIGLSAGAYVRAGGCPGIPLGEDHALVEALAARGVAVARLGAHPVASSARHDPRAAGGFGALLRELAARVPA